MTLPTRWFEHRPPQGGVDLGPHRLQFLSGPGHLDHHDPLAGPPAGYVLLHRGNVGALDPKRDPAVALPVEAQLDKPGLVGSPPMDLLPEVLGVAVDRLLTVGSLVCADLGHVAQDGNPATPPATTVDASPEGLSSGTGPLTAPHAADEQDTGHQDTQARSLRQGPLRLAHDSRLLGSVCLFSAENSPLHGSCASLIR